MNQSAHDRLQDFIRLLTTAAANAALYNLEHRQVDRLCTQALEELQTLLETVNDNLDASSETSYRINATLMEIEGAARSIRLLADYLERNPEALIQGKPDR